MPQAITCALELGSFEDTVRNAISLGGDADTFAAIGGPIAEAIHGIPKTFKAQVETRYLASAPEMLEILKAMYVLV